MPLKLFYLDDEVPLLEVFATLYASDAVEVIVASDPSRAIEMILNDRPDLLFIDYRLPKITGEQVAQLVDPNIVKVLVTGEINITPSPLFRTYFSKPYDTAAIRAFIDAEVLKKRSQLSVI